MRSEEEAIEIDTTLRDFLEQRFQSIFVDTEDRILPISSRCGVSSYDDDISSRT